MASRLSEIFKDEKLVEKIKKRLPYLFQLAEIECSRAGKIGMQVGSLRENIIVALLIHKFGKENVETEIPITEPETDVKVSGYPVSIKTITGFGGIKASWTVDPDKVQEFRETYTPKCDILLVLIKWGKVGNLFYIPREVQQKVLRDMGYEDYILPPKMGTPKRTRIQQGSTASTCQRSRNQIDRHRMVSFRHKIQTLRKMDSVLAK